MLAATTIDDPITVRAAADGDADSLHAYLAALTAEQLPVLFARAQAPTRERVAEMIARNTSDQRYLLLVAIEDGRVVGMLDFFGKPLAQQHHVGGFGMTVDRGWRGRGIGTRLLRSLLAWAAQRGYRRIELEVFANNPDAIRLYEREGVVPEGRRRGAIVVDGAEIDLVLMARRI
jgi:RimJ/RimL family protein N-acetyltransferase